MRVEPSKPSHQKPHVPVHMSFFFLERKTRCPLHADDQDLVSTNSKAVETARGPFPRAKGRVHTAPVAIRWSRVHRFGGGSHSPRTNWSPLARTPLVARSHLDDPLMEPPWVSWRNELSSPSHRHQSPGGVRPLRSSGPVAKPPKQEPQLCQRQQTLTD